MKKVFLPTDFSENARKSLEYAARLFVNEPVEFIVIHAYDPIPTPAYVTSTKLDETIEADSLQDLEKERQFLSGKVHHPDTILTILSRKGALSTVLRNSGANREVDLIIMSPSGEGQSTDFGSNTLAVMRNSQIPVLVIIEHKPFIPYKKVLFAADLAGYSRDMLSFPLDFFVHEFNSSIEVVHFGLEDSEEKTEEMADLVKIFGAERTSVEYVREDNVLEGLNNSIAKSRPDLLVLVNRHRWFFSRLFIKSVTRNMIVDSPIPILVLQDNE